MSNKNWKKITPVSIEVDEAPIRRKIIKRKFPCTTLSIFIGKLGMVLRYSKFSTKFSKLK